MRTCLLFRGLSRQSVKVEGMRSEAFLAACVALCLIAGCSNSSTEGARPEEASGRAESLEKVTDRGVTTTALSATTTTPTAASTTTMTPMNSDLMHTTSNWIYI